MGAFQDKIIEGSISQPTSKKYSRKKWKAAYLKYRTDFKDDEIFHAGRVLNSYLYWIRKKVHLLNLRRLGKKNAIIGLCALLNRELSVLHHQIMNNTNPDNRTMLAEKLVGPEHINIKDGVKADPNAVLESIIASIRYAFQTAQSFPEDGEVTRDSHLDILNIFRLANYYFTFTETWKAILSGYYEVKLRNNTIHIVPSNISGSLKREMAIARRKYDLITTAFNLENSNKHFPFFPALKLTYDRAKDKLYPSKIESFEASFFESQFYFLLNNSRYYLDYPLPHFNNITLFDFWKNYLSISRLGAEHIDRMATLDGKCDSWVELIDSYSISIVKDEAISLLSPMVNMEKKDVNRIIDIFTVDYSGTEDLSTKFFIHLDGKIYPLFITFDPNPQYLTEFWLKAGGVDLGERGGGYEKHIKSLFKIIDEEFHVCLCDRKINFKKKEEIDIAFIFGKSLYLCELKCSMYPAEYIDRVNYDKTIFDAVDQIERKAKFVSNNMSEFMVEYFQGKDVVDIKTLVISNQVEHSGEKIKNTIIVDDSAFFVFFDKQRPELRTINNANEDDFVELMSEKQKALLNSSFYETKETAHFTFESYLTNLPQNSFFEDNVSIYPLKIPATRIVFWSPSFIGG